jgi:hypothetical protein
MNRWLLNGCFGLLAVGLGACTDVQAPTEPGSGAGAGGTKTPDLLEKIVNGRVESGYPAVGALEIGGLCTGTLIADKWVVSAAHCFADGFNGGNFMIGNSVNDRGARRVRIARAYVHQGYDANRLVNDIALVELVESAGIAPMEIARTAPRVGESVKYVGFGVSDGIRDTGSGIKRSVDIGTTRVDATTLRSDDPNVNTCRGDSGGPGMRLENGVEVVGTVTSWGDQECQQFGVNTRVDAYVSWIEGIVGAQNLGGGGNPVDPGNNPDPIDPNPVNPGAGGLSCSGVFDCYDQCQDDACANACDGQASANGSNLLNNLWACADQNQCPDWACVEQNCSNEYNICLADVGAGNPDPGSDPGANPVDPGLAGAAGGSCGGLLDCTSNCNDQWCLQNCVASADPASITDYNTLAVCSQQAGCSDWNCVQQRCGGQLDQCVSAGGGAIPGANPVDPGAGGAGVPVGANLGCGDIFACFGTCQNDACYDQCIDRAGPQAQNAFFSLDDCAYFTGCQDNACVERFCADELVACFGY